MEMLSRVTSYFRGPERVLTPEERKQQKREAKIKKEEEEAQATWDLVERTSELAERVKATVLDAGTSTRLLSCMTIALGLSLVSGGIAAYALLNHGRFLQLSGGVAIGGLGLIGYTLYQDRKPYTELLAADKTLKGKIKKLEKELKQKDYQELYEKSGGQFARLLAYPRVVPLGGTVQELQDRIEAVRAQSRAVWSGSIAPFSAIAVLALLSVSALVWGGTSRLAAIGAGGIWSSILGTTVVGLSYATLSSRQSFLRKALERRRNQLMGHTREFPSSPVEIDCLHFAHRNKKGEVIRDSLSRRQLQQLASHQVKKLEMEVGSRNDADLSCLRGQKLERLMLFRTLTRERLMFNDFGQVSGSILRKLQHPSYLKQLRLPRLEVPIDGKVAKQFGQLKEFQIGRLTDPGLPCLAHFPSVTDLKIDFGPPLQVSQLPRQLEKVALPTLRPAPEADASNVAYTHRRLQEVSVLSADGPSIRALSQLKELRKMHLLDIDDSTVASDALDWLLADRCHVKDFTVSTIHPFSIDTLIALRQRGSLSVTQADGKKVAIETDKKLRELHAISPTSALKYKKITFEPFQNPLSGFMS